MTAKSFQTVEQIDQRFVWLDKEIEIAARKADDCASPNRDKFKTRAVNLRHEKAVLTRRRNLLLTPVLL